MSHIKPLPRDLVARHKSWHTSTYPKQAPLFRNLMDEGQFPPYLIISCSDSRIDVSNLFGVDPGQFFMHRNIANLVPPFQPDGDYHGTPAVLEYAVTALKVQHIVVIGHSGCGGVKGCIDKCSGNAPSLESADSLVGKWIELLRPGFERVAKRGSSDMQEALEKEGVLVSLENLETYPFIEQALDASDLSLHGVWYDIANGSLEQYNTEKTAFEAI